MKKYIYIITSLLLFSAANAFSQDFVKEQKGIKKVKILEIYGNLNIEGISSEKIQISKKGEKELPVDADMAKPEFYKNENTQIGLSFEYNDGIVIISPANQEAQFTNYDFKIPGSAILEIKTEHLDEKIEITDTKNTEIFNKINGRKMEGEINIEVFASDINLSDVTGPLTLATFVGNHIIDFSELNQDSPSSIEMFAGNIDVILPRSSNFNTQLGVKVGDIYSEFEIDVTELIPLKSGVTLDGRLSDKTENTGKKYDAAKVTGKVKKGGIALNVNTFTGVINLKMK